MLNLDRILNQERLLRAMTGLNRQAFNEPLSQLIVAWVAQEGSQRQLAERFKVSLSFVKNLVRRYRETGQVEPKQCGGYEKPIIAGQYLNMIKSWLDEKNDLLLSELCDRLRETTGTSVSITTMHRALEKLGLRHKKKSKCQ
ncbi:helix-turn-helix domain-containing protein [Cylindrospermopsis raciborskii]|jgi:transposase|uniref:helix-turn-helix domain-containing protein n=1 Tax=Cylindrospermopsis raciborskii TaxID=77022 RepID=UPI001F294D91|nr:helix-turn-helix domain-containing protein [Cylindrospermopsis raciborskii]UJS06222.1 helix-turn-helix domain-containing protein [Cylindrospermopsis raciborskii KLL07]